MSEYRLNYGALADRFGIVFMSHDMLDEPIDGMHLTEQLAQAQLELVTIRDWIRFSVTLMRSYDLDLGQGTDDFFAEATALVMQTLSLDWSADEQILSARVVTSEKQAITDLLRERIETRKPLCYLLNMAYFCGLPFYVDERVLIPRSPIAEVIQSGLAPYFNGGVGVSMSAVRGMPARDAQNIAAPEHILDLCTGSGCIAIALARQFPQAHVDASDISRDALEVAALNIEHHELTAQVNLIESNLFEKIPAAQQYDVIVSNPPYVDAAEMADLPTEFSHEPELALAAGQDGLDIVRTILCEAARYLRPNGLLIVEVGFSEWALQQNYEAVDFAWLQFSRGGSGVFVLTAAQCQHYQSIFDKNR